MTDARTKRFPHWYRRKQGDRAFPFPLKQARGRELDRLGDMLCLPRRRWWIFAWPLDRWYRRALLAMLKGLP